MLPRTIRRSLAPTLRGSTLRARLARTPAQRRWHTPAPKPGSGPLMSRRADRDLPDIADISFRWRRTLPLFAAIVTLCSLAIFNYQKMSSPVVASTMYALRTCPRARELLGDEVYFRHQIPWIRGTMNQLQGKIDIWFTVKGTRGTATMRFASNRRSHQGVFETTEWSLTTQEGEWVDLLEEGDPFAHLVEEEEEEGAVAEKEVASRGFRSQQPSFR